MPTKKNKTQTNSNQYKEIPRPTANYFSLLSSEEIPTTYKGRKSPLHHQYSFQELKMHKA
jgi:hypothetical protein